MQGEISYRWVAPVARMKLRIPVRSFEFDLEPIGGPDAVVITIVDEGERALFEMALRERTRFRVEIPAEMRFPQTLTIRSDRFDCSSPTDARIRSFRAFAITPSDRWEILRRLTRFGRS